MARCTKAKAKECSDLLLMAIYTLMPPSRALEIRTLVVASTTQKGKNTVCLEDNRSVKFRFEDYKTATTYGADETLLEVRFFVKSKEHMIYFYLSNVIYLY